MTARVRSDYAIRSITTAIIALSCVFAVIVEQLTTGKVDPNLQGWGSLIIGAYFGSHIATNGKMVTALTKEKQP